MRLGYSKKSRLLALAIIWIAVHVSVIHGTVQQEHTKDDIVQIENVAQLKLYARKLSSYSIGETIVFDAGMFVDNDAKYWMDSNFRNWLRFWVRETNGDVVEFEGPLFNAETRIQEFEYYRDTILHAYLDVMIGCDTDFMNQLYYKPPNIGEDDAKAIFSVGGFRKLPFGCIDVQPGKEIEVHVSYHPDPLSAKFLKSPLCEKECKIPIGKIDSNRLKLTIEPVSTS